MEVLDPRRIRIGKLLLYIGLAGLVAVHLIGLINGLIHEGWAGMDRLHLWRTAAIVVGGLGTLRGGKPIRFIYIFVLTVVAIVEIYPLWDSSLELLDVLMAATSVIFAVFLIYLLLANRAVSDFLRSQRALYFGQRVAVASTEVSNNKGAANAEQGKPADEWEVHDDLYE